MMKIYTRKGDAGETGLLGGARVSKNHLRVETYGTIDEANAFIGLALAHLGEEGSKSLGAMLRRVQRELFDLGADLAVAPGAGRRRTVLTRPEFVQAFEADIDRMEAGLEPLTSFILPGGCAAAAALHAARAVCRRAERRLVTLAGTDMIDAVILQYVNRLSDLLFVAAREANRAAGLPDVKVE